MLKRYRINPIAAPNKINERAVPKFALKQNIISVSALIRKNAISSISETTNKNVCETFLKVRPSPSYAKNTRDMRNTSKSAPSTAPIASE